MRFRPQSYQTRRPFLGLRFRVGILICWDSFCYSPNSEKRVPPASQQPTWPKIWPGEEGGGGGSRKGQDRRV